MSVGPLVAALSGVPAGRIVDRLGAHKMTVSVLVGIAAGLSLLAAMRVKVGVIGYMLPIAIVTAGYAFFQAANNTAVMTGTGKEERGAISGMLNLSRNLGLITGASVMGTIFVITSCTSDMTHAHSEAVARGMGITFATAAILMVAALAIALRSRARESGGKDEVGGTSEGGLVRS